MKTINNELIRSFNPCYDPSEKNIPDDEALPVLEWVNKYRGIVPDNDIIWLLYRPKFMSEKDMRLFAVWCAREALKLLDNPDKRSINACTIAEKFALGESTDEDLAEAAAWAAERAAERAAAWAAGSAERAAGSAARAARAAEAAREAWAHQLTKLLTYFK